MKLSATHAFNCILLMVKFGGPLVKTFLRPCSTAINSYHLLLRAHSQYFCTIIVILVETVKLRAIMKLAMSFGLTLLLSTAYLFTIVSACLHVTNQLANQLKLQVYTQFYSFMCRINIAANTQLRITIDIQLHVSGILDIKAAFPQEPLEIGIPYQYTQLNLTIMIYFLQN